MDHIIKKYMDFWETVTYETLLNPCIMEQWQALMKAQGLGPFEEAEPSSDA